ncbi:MAG: PilN domain-containing protein [Bdellovibrionota bacterium]
MKKHLRFEGAAADGPTVTTFVDNLRGSKFFSNIDLLRVEQVSEKGQNRQKFYINCTLHTGGNLEMNRF